MQNTADNDPFHYHMDIMVGGLIDHIARERGRSQQHPRPPSVRDASPDRPVLNPVISMIHNLHREILADYDNGLGADQGILLLVFGQQQQQQQAVPPANNTAALLEKHVYRANKSKADAEKCPICLAKYGNTVRRPQVRFDCNHRFHRSCAKRWLDTSATCPTCRAELDK